MGHFTTPFMNIEKRRLPKIHWKFWGGRIDFCVESYWVIESSRIKYLQGSRPESFWYYSIIHGTRWNFSRWNNEYILYKRVVYYFPSRWKKIYLIVFSPKFLFLNFFLKFLTKISVKNDELIHTHTHVHLFKIKNPLKK